MGHSINVRSGKAHHSDGPPVVGYRCNVEDKANQQPGKGDRRRDRNLDTHRWQAVVVLHSFTRTRQANPDHTGYGAGGQMMLSVSSSSNLSSLRRHGQTKIKEQKNWCVEPTGLA